MAFIELTEEEIKLLTKAEKEQYYKDYNLYRQRIDFVEKIERIEKSDYHYEKPKLNRIKPVRRIDLPRYMATEKYQVVLPKAAIFNSELKSNSQRRASLNSKIRSALISRYNVSVPKIKLLTPLNYAPYRNNNKINISNVNANKKKVKPLVVKAKPLEKPIVSISKEKVELPQIRKYTGVSSVKIKDCPSIAVKQLTKKKFEFTRKENNTNNILEKAKSAKVKLPNTSFVKEIPILKIKDISKSKVFITDTSAIKEKLKEGNKYNIDIDKHIFKPVLPVYNKYTPKSFIVSSISKRKIKAPDIIFAKPETGNIDINPVKIKLPEKKKFTNYVSGKVTGIEKMNVNVPEIKSYDFEHSDISDLPKVFVKTPDYSTEDVKNVMWYNIIVTRRSNLKS